MIEIASSGPSKVCGVMLADLGADVVLVEAPFEGAGQPRPADICNRGKRSVALDIGRPEGLAAVLDLVATADILIEGAGPGVAEAMGIGPEACLRRRSSLVYGRSSACGQGGGFSEPSGWGGHGAALSGALWMATAPGRRPPPVDAMIGEVGGGALYLAIGVLAATLSARRSGTGQVVDAAILDGCAHMLNLSFVMLPHRGSLEDIRPASNEWHALRSYRCADGGWVNVSAIEPKFYDALLAQLGLENDEPFIAGLGDAQACPVLAARLEAIFVTKTRDIWCELLEGRETCFAPVLTPQAAARHPHNLSRGLYVAVEDVLQVVAAPRFDRTPSARPAAVPRLGRHSAGIMATIDRAGPAVPIQPSGRIGA